MYKHSNKLSQRELARLDSTPLAVRRRREALGVPDASMNTGVTADKQYAYEMHKARGKFLHLAEPPKVSDWVKEREARQRVIRGYGVGRKIYLPNIIFRLVPNYTPPGKAYNPYEATFRVPLSLTKTDVRGYLFAMYGLKVTFIRTDIYYAPIERQFRRPKGRMKSHKTYKRVVVGLHEPFYFPHMPEEMTRKERRAHREWLVAKFNIDQVEAARRKAQVLSLGMKPTWRGKVSGKKNIMKAAAKRRDSVERQLTGRVKQMMNWGKQAKAQSADL
ncbi:uncharacterized protein EI90DRAFT_3071876 [Cantharellus anzutake]|uniref:uncharacterized protein n=1 Tax=Cantharellus anzutake TaxID=1750568 RepID=UPI0019069E72|nr:uncharacterized protein EI90DRAFT_3071876 [Cantharellus anzutake]KAF8325841.1 hypothetical protein EI90DRAFT_3071876 [Cantharellus anzutake]